MLDVINLLTFKSGASVFRYIVFKKKNKLVKLYKNVSVVNYLACMYNDFISVVTTFIFIFDFNIILIYKVKLINK